MHGASDSGQATLPDARWQRQWRTDGKSKRRDGRQAHGEGEVALVRYDAMRTAIAACKSVDEVKQIHDKALALKAYAKQVNDKQAQVEFSEIYMRAERELGRMLRESAENGERAGRGQRKNEMSHAATLDELGISRDLSSRAQAIATIPDDEFEQTLAEHRWEIKTP